MKLFVGYTIFNKVDMIVWLLDGIVQHFDPATTLLGFVFDACEDGSMEHFECVRKHWLEDRGFSPVAFKSEQAVREVGGHNILLKFFMENTDCDMMFAPQDDQKIEQAIVPYLQEVRDLYGDQLGLIGGRDGYFERFSNMASSIWSESKTHVTLEHGQHVIRPMLNSGPIAYDRRLVEKVGCIDPGFHAFYAWDDYCQRAIKLGHQNLVMGMNLKHSKFGRNKACSFYEPGIAAKDLALFAGKHGIPL